MWKTKKRSALSCVCVSSSWNERRLRPIRVNVLCGFGPSRKIKLAALYHSTTANYQLLLVPAIKHDGKQGLSFSLLHCSVDLFVFCVTVVTFFFYSYSFLSVATNLTTLRLSTEITNSTFSWTKSEFKVATRTPAPHGSRRTTRWLWLNSKLCILPSVDCRWTGTVLHVALWRSRPSNAHFQGCELWIETQPWSLCPPGNGVPLRVLCYCTLQWYRHNSVAVQELNWLYLLESM